MVVMNQIEQNVKVRQASNTLIELGISLAKYEELEPEAVRWMWKCLIETASELIGEQILPLKSTMRLPVVERYGAEAPSAPPAPPAPWDHDLFPFGSHEGETYSQIPDNYFRWLSQQPWIEKWPDVLAYIQEHELD